MTGSKMIKFLAVVQKEHRIQIPIEIRQHHKLEPKQTLRMGIQPLGRAFVSSVDFYARLSVDGRITVPWEVSLRCGLTTREMIRVYLYPED
jgi:bifunctional DNA-binding transcriptional regulator/antitoxin component of YhaV-PrlF toxin-antitoxin module